MAGNKTKYLKACTLKFMQWREDGKAPSTRAAALDIVSKELRAIGQDIGLNDLKAQLARSILNEDEPELIDSNLAFIVWDLTVNNGKAFDYSVGQNYFSGLLQQVRNVLYTNSREVLTLSVKSTGLREKMTKHSAGTKKLGALTIYSDPEKGAVQIKNLSQNQLDALAEKFIEEAKTRILRWKVLGANRMFVFGVLKKIEKEILPFYVAPRRAISLVPRPVKRVSHRRRAA